MKKNFFIKSFLLSMLLLSFPKESEGKKNEITTIKYIINGQVITNYDIAVRKAFLTLSRSDKDPTQEMINQVLKNTEIKKMQINIPKEQVDFTYLSFAQSNNMDSVQMKQFLQKFGITEEHFKELLFTEIAWNELIKLKLNSDLSQNYAIKRKKEKFYTKEYTLQNVIFIVPNHNPAFIEKRKREAEVLRSKFKNCDTTKEQIKNILDVSIKNLKRLTEFSLPPYWQSEILSLQKSGQTTPTKITQNGVEFLALCKIRKISDESLQYMQYLKENNSEEKKLQESIRYLTDLRKKATIIKR